MTKPIRILSRIAVALIVVLIVGGIACVLVLRSAWFHERVRERMIAEIERTTGGRVEMGSYNFDWKRLLVTVAPLVLHGKEATDEPPLLRIPSMSLGLRIVSAFERKIDLVSLRVDQPAVHVVVYPDGSTNLPTPVVHDIKTWAQDLLDFRVIHYQILDGFLQYDDRKYRLNVQGENLQVRMMYQPNRPLYRGELSSRRVRVAAPDIIPSGGTIEFDMSADFALERARIEFSRIHLMSRQSSIDLAGSLTDPEAPHGTFTINANAPVKDLVALFHAPLAPTGVAAFDGRLAVSFVKNFDFSLVGRASGRGIGYRRDRLKIEGADVQGDINLTRENLVLRGVNIALLGSTITGQGELADWQKFHFEGNVDGLSVREAARITTDRPISLNGTLTGGFTVDTVLGQPAATKLATNIRINAGAEGMPIEGQLDVAYDQQGGVVRLGQSYLATPASRLDFSGALGGTLEVKARSTNLGDLMSAMSIAGYSVPAEFPLKLNRGNATFTGIVSGPLDDLHINGQTSLAKASFEGHAFDRFSSDVEGSRGGLWLQGMTLARGASRIEGSASITAVNGKFEDGAVAAQLNLRDAPLAELGKEFKSPVMVAGTAAGSVHLSGTPRRPEAEIAIQVEKPTAFGEQADRLQASLRYSPEEIDITAGEVDTAPGKLRFDGAYVHREADWKDGQLRFDLAAEALPVSRAQALSKIQPTLQGTLDGKASGTARIAQGQVTLTSAQGDSSLRGITLDRQALGDVNIAAETHGAELTLRANAKMLGATLDAQGSWPLELDRAGSAKIRFSRLDVSTLHTLATIKGTPEERDRELPFEGFVEGSATLSGALAKPQDFRLLVTLDTVQINPKTTRALRLGVQPQDVVIKNTKPVEIAITSKEGRIAEAQFTARDTSLEISGGVPFYVNASADLAVRGSVNLAVLQLLNRDLLARGSATVQASVRGSLTNPQLNGRMDLKNASLYLADLPTGVDNANGSVVFDRNRATIEKLTAETGGGLITLGGFVEFSSALVYRLQAQGQNVRLRYDNIGVTTDARLALNGTSDSSTVSGELTLTRATAGARADLGQLIATASRPAPAPPPNEYLRGMQFDVRIESAPTFDFQTSLTRDVEASVDLRLRGTPLRPTLLGTVSISQGEMEVFGNRYTIDRGDIRFLNPVRIEPSFDVNLETKARGITVNIDLSGTLQKLNVNYSSDPPLPTRDIIALLAVGRVPSQTADMAALPSTAGTSNFGEAGGGLLSRALSEQQSSRLQRFFGASHLKIDPTITGVEFLPEARLTFEQQVSHDITLTYITNLNRTEEQIVQVEYDFGQHWSAVATREASGLFGIDFQYKKRFK